MFPHVSLATELPWQPGPYPGVELCLTVPAHVHPLANETAYVLQGEWWEDGRPHGPGTCFFAPKGVRHGPHEARGEVISLTVFDGPLTVA
jgi:hypothetical protein